MLAGAGYARELADGGCKRKEDQARDGRLYTIPQLLPDVARQAPYLEPPYGPSACLHTHRSLTCQLDARINPFRSSKLPKALLLQNLQLRTDQLRSNRVF